MADDPFAHLAIAEQPADPFAHLALPDETDPFAHLAIGATEEPAPRSAAERNRMRLDSIAKAEHDAAPQEGPLQHLAAYTEPAVRWVNEQQGIYPEPPARAITTPAELLASRQRASAVEDAHDVGNAQIRAGARPTLASHVAETAHLDAEEQRLSDNPAALEMINARRQAMAEEQARSEGRMPTEGEQVLHDAWNGVSNVGGAVARGVGNYAGRLPTALNAASVASMQGKGTLDQLGGAANALWTGQGPSGAEQVRMARETGKPGSQALHTLALALGGTELSDVTDAIEEGGRDVVLPMTPFPLLGRLAPAGVKAEDAFQKLRLAKLRGLAVQDAGTAAKIAERLPGLEESALKTPWERTVEGQFAKDQRMGLGIRVQGPLGIGTADIPIIPGRFVPKAVGRAADATLEAIRKSPAAAWVARSAKIPSLLTPQEQDALMMQHWNGKEQAYLAAGIEQAYRAEDKGLAGIRARFDRAVPAEDALLNPLEKQDRAMVRALEIGRGEALEQRVGAAVEAGTLHPDEGAYLVRVHDEFNATIEEDIRRGVPVKYLGNEDLTYLHHAMTAEAKAELLKRADLTGRPWERAQTFMQQLRKAPAFAEERTSKLDVLAANAYAKEKLGLKANLFHTDVAYISAVRKLASVRARGAAQLVRALGEQFGIRDAMPALEEMAAGELKRESEDVFYAIQRGDHSLKPRYAEVQAEVARRANAGKVRENWEQVPIDSDSPASRALPVATGTDLEHLRITQKAGSRGVAGHVDLSDLERRPFGAAQPVRDTPRGGYGAAETDAASSYYQRPMAEHPPVTPSDAATFIGPHDVRGGDYNPLGGKEGRGYDITLGPRARRTMAPEGWKIIKDGLLDGVAMPPELHPYMQRLQELASGPASPAVQALTDTWNAYSHWWKAWTLTPRPPFHVRNAFSSMVQNYIGGTAGWRELAGSFAALWDPEKNGTRILTNQKTGKDVMTMAELLDEMERGGSLRTQFSGSLDRMEQNAKRELEQSGYWDMALGRGAQATKHTLPILGDVTVPAGVNRAGRAVQAWVPMTTAEEARSLWLKGGTATGNLVESQARIQHAIGRIEQGDSIEQALLSVDKHHFDYAAPQSAAERYVNVAIPFLKFMKGSFALHLEGMVMQPEKYARINRFWGSLRSGEAPPDSFMPDYQQEQHLIPTRMERDRNGKLTGIATATGLGSFDPTQDWDKLLGAQGFHPVIQAIWGTLANKDPHTGRAIDSGPGQRRTEVFGGNPPPLAGFLAKQLTPQILQDWVRLGLLGGTSGKTTNEHGQVVAQPGSPPDINLWEPLNMASRALGEGDYAPKAQSMDGTGLSLVDRVGRFAVGVRRYAIDYPKEYQNRMRTGARDIKAYKAAADREMAAGNTREAGRQMALLEQARSELVKLQVDYAKSGLPSHPADPEP